jgi:O-Antigen ligase
LDLQTEWLKRIALVVLAVLQPLSAVWLVPGGEGLGISYFRVFLFACLVITATFATRQNSGLIKRSLSAAIGLALLMLCFVPVVENLPNLFREMSYVLEIFALTVVMHRLLSTDKDILFLLRLVAVIGLVIASYAVYEIETGDHLNQAFQPDAFWRPELSYKLDRQAWVVFGNPNDLCVHLLFAGSCAIFAALISKRKWEALFAVVIATMLTYLALELSSRTVIIAFVLTILTLIFANKLGSIAVTLVFSALVFMFAISDQLEMAFSVQSDFGFFGDTSSLIRARLAVVGWQMLTDSLLIGTGAGSFEDYVLKWGYFPWTFGIVNPHNAYVRILAENGIVGFVLYLYILFRPFFFAVTQNSKHLERRILMALTAAISLSLIVGSNPTASSTIHLAIALVWVFAQKLSGGAPTAQKFNRPQNLHPQFDISRNSKSE